MKKLLCVLLAGVLALSMAACGNSAQNTETAAEELPESGEAEDTAAEGGNEEAQEPEETEEIEAAADSADMEGTEETTETAENGQNILIAYFSWSGNTEELAGMIQNETGGDLFEIEPAEPYTDDYDALLDQARQEQRENARPELEGEV